MYTTIARFNSVCATSGKRIKKGESMVYDNITKKCYAIGYEPKRTDESKMIEANENAFFDNFCLNNNI